jgi:hypothetical protein
VVVDLKKNPSNGSPSVVATGNRTVLEVVKPNASAGSSEIDRIGNVNIDYYKYFSYGDAHTILDYEDDMDKLQSAICDSLSLQFSIPDLRKIVQHARALIYHDRGGY